MKRRLFFRGIVCMFLMAWSGGALADKVKTDSQAAIDFIQSLGDQTVDLLSDENASATNRVQGMQKLLRKHLDLETMGRFALGAKWRKISEGEREEYLTLFSDYVVTSYAKRLGGYTNQTFSIDSSGPAGRYDALVNTVIVAQDQPEIKAGWRVRTLSEGTLKIIDLVVEGVSMLQTERAQFDTVMQSGGVDGLLNSLRLRVEKSEQDAG